MYTLINSRPHIKAKPNSSDCINLRYSTHYDDYLCFISLTIVNSINRDYRENKENALTIANI